MSYQTLEVELENGVVRPSGTEALPVKAHALLTILDTEAPETFEHSSVTVVDRPGPALTCAELADRWERLLKLPPDEASAFADDLEKARLNLPPVKSAWD